ncbi:MAG: isoprenylcysteine carboxylmethyltransferase family protein [Rhodobacterales bacterium]|nr:isoprenylcysteine carboxylmethyltransferase family protein [Rhodobacterales bacterium]
MTRTARPVEVNQVVRINILRVTFLLCLPAILLTESAWPEYVFEVLEILGLAAVIAAVLGRFWSILYIGGHKNNTVMQDGPYSVCRHPLYLFSTLGVVGLGLLLGSFVLALGLGGLTLLILSVTARKEEAILRGMFGSAYDDYAARVPMILPKPSLFQSPPTVTVSVPHLRENLMDALVFLTFIPLAELMQWIKEMNLFPTFPIF